MMKRWVARCLVTVTFLLWIRVAVVLVVFQNKKRDEAVTAQYIDSISKELSDMLDYLRGLDRFRNLNSWDIKCGKEGDMSSVYENVVDALVAMQYGVSNGSKSLPTHQVVTAIDPSDLKTPILICNRVPKTGSTTLMMFTQRLANTLDFSLTVREKYV